MIPLINLKEMPEFVSICSFIQIFGEDLNINLTHSQLTKSLYSTDLESTPLNWIDIHVKLLARILNRCTKEEWQKYLNKFIRINKVSDLYNMDYFSLTPQQKTKLFNMLCDSIFQNIAFKKKVNNKDVVSLRPDAYGTDIVGCIYWLFIDADKDIFMYKHNLEEESFKIVAESIDDMCSLLEELRVILFENVDLSKLHLKSSIAEDTNSTDVNSIEFKDLTIVVDRLICNSDDVVLSEEVDKIGTNRVKSQIIIEDNTIETDTPINGIKAVSNSAINDDIIAITKTNVLNEVRESDLQLKEIDNAKIEQEIILIEIDDSDSENEINYINKKKSKRKIDCLKNIDEVDKQEIVCIVIEDSEDEVINPKKRLNCFRRILPKPFTNTRKTYTYPRSNKTNNINLQEQLLHNNSSSGKSINTDKGKLLTNRRKRRAHQIYVDSTVESSEVESDVSSILKIEFIDNDRPESDFDFVNVYSDEETLKCHGKNFLRQRLRLLKIENYEVIEDDKPCQICLCNTFPEMILHCDTCTFGYHALCLKPSFMVIPDREWFCPKCQHKELIEKLAKETKKLSKYKLGAQKKEIRKRFNICSENIIAFDKYSLRKPKENVRYNFYEIDKMLDNYLENDEKDIVLSDGIYDPVCIHDSDIWVEDDLHEEREILKGNCLRYSNSCDDNYNDDDIKNVWKNKKSNILKSTQKDPIRSTRTTRNSTRIANYLKTVDKNSFGIDNCSDNDSDSVNTVKVDGKNSTRIVNYLKTVDRNSVGIDNCSDNDSDSVYTVEVDGKSLEVMSNKNNCVFVPPMETKSTELIQGREVTFIEELGDTKTDSSLVDKINAKSFDYNREYEFVEVKLCIKKLKMKEGVVTIEDVEYTGHEYNETKMKITADVNNPRFQEEVILDAKLCI